MQCCVINERQKASFFVMSCISHTGLTLHSGVWCQLDGLFHLSLGDTMSNIVWNDTIHLSTH